MLEVVHLVRTTRRDRIEAIAEVAKRHHVARETVADKCCRRLSLNTTAFDMLLNEPGLSGLERALRKQYPEYATVIAQVVRALRR